MIRGPALLAATAMLGSCGEPQLLTVDRYLAQCEALRGGQVRVAGYLGNCSGYDCALYADKARARAYFDYFASLARTTRIEDKAARKAALDKLGDAPRSIGIGGDQAFDRKAAPFQNSYVVLTGVVAKDSCTGEGSLDRGWGIDPSHIRAWTPSEGAPANTN